jgi:hypothetical protein
MTENKNFDQDGREGIFFPAIGLSATKGLARCMMRRREELFDWLAARDERFYRAFLLAMLGLFAFLTYFWMLAAGALVATFMWWILYETMIIKRN